MGKIQFESEEHKQFFYEMLGKSRKQDCYHQSFFYCIGISEDTRNNVERLFDFERDRIRPEGLHDGWQTSGSMRVTRLAFNLWNGYAEKGKEKLSSPYEIFDCGYAPYCFEAIRLRYPDYCREYVYSYDGDSGFRKNNQIER